MNDDPSIPPDPISEKTITPGNFISVALEWLSSRQNARIMIIADSPSGFELLRNDFSIPWCLGACDAAKDAYIQEGRRRTEAGAQEINRRMQEEADRINDSIARDSKGRKN